MNRQNIRQRRLRPQPRLLVLGALLFFFLSTPAAASVPGGLTPAQDDQPIKIGLLVTADTSSDRLSRQAADVVQLMVDQLNDSGGIDGRKVRVVLKSTEGHWGAGSKRSVSLIYEDNVSAIIGFLDGRSAHLVEQVCTKAQVPFLSTYSPDPTLSRVNIPWFFSTMPHAGQQAKPLVNEIYGAQNRKKVTIVASDNYDQEYMVRAFRREVERNGYPGPSVLRYPADTTALEDIASEVAGSDTEGIVFFGSTEEWNSWGALLADTGFQRPHFLPVMELNEKTISPLPFPVLGMRSVQIDRSGEEKFIDQFRDRYDYRPGRFAYYLHDGIRALLESIKMNGMSTTEIQQGLRELNVTGITGPVSFGESGMRKGTYEVVQYN